jgi:hypothetical protein
MTSEALTVMNVGATNFWDHDVLQLARKLKVNGEAISVNITRRLTGL